MTLVEICVIAALSWLAVGAIGYNMLVNPQRLGTPPNNTVRFSGLALSFLGGPITLIVASCMGKQPLHEAVLAEAGKPSKGFLIPLKVLEGIAATSDGKKFYGNWYYPVKLGYAKEKGTPYYVQNLRVESDKLLGDVLFYDFSELSKEFLKVVRKGKIKFSLKGEAKTVKESNDLRKVVNFHLTHVNAVQERKTTI